MEEDKIVGKRVALAVAVAAWLAYEIIMGVALWDTFTVNDYAALAGKITYLAGLLSASLRDPWDMAAYAAIVSPTAAAAVRGSMGWLSYTLFTVIVPAIGIASAAVLARTGRRGFSYLFVANSIALILYAATLPGNLYEAPEDPRILELAPLPAFALLSLHSACIEGRWHIYPLLAVLTTLPILVLAA